MSTHTHHDNRICCTTTHNTHQLTLQSAKQQQLQQLQPQPTDQLTMAATANYKLFTPLTLADDLVLKNRVVMSPMTRARADIQTHTPTDLQALYYEQRAGAGLIITEATTISEHSFGWIGSPALYTQEHVDAWKKVVDRVHAKNGKIFVQIWHMGRLVHPSFNAKGDVVSASDVQLTEGHTRDAYGNEAAFVKPRPLEVDEITGIAEDFRRSAELAKLAGFDGVEVHASGGYLVDQFLQANTNKRTDRYGGSFENRARFLFQILDAVKTVWPANHIGVRISPNGAYGQMGNPDNYDMFTYVMKRLSAHKLAYLAIQDGFGFGYHDKGRLVTLFDAKSHFQGPVIATNSYTRDIAEGAVRSGGADMVAFGRLYMSNPDLAERFQNDWPLNPDAGYEAYWDPREGEKGYTTFPAYTEAKLSTLTIKSPVEDESPEEPKAAVVEDLAVTDEKKRSRLCPKEWGRLLRSSKA